MEADDRSYIQPCLCGSLQVPTMVSPIAGSQGFVTLECACLKCALQVGCEDPCIPSW